MAVLCIAAAGCGYTVRSSLDEKFQTIHVAAFTNESREYDLQAPLTNAIIRKFLNDTRLRVVPRARADLVMEGSILNYELRGLTFDRNDDVTQFLTMMTARVRVIDNQTGLVLWEDPGLTSESSFLTRTGSTPSDRLRGNTQTFLPSIRSFQTSEENQAASEVLEQIATNIFFRTVEPW